jgi:hypothetical protein
MRGHVTPPSGIVVFEEKFLYSFYFILDISLKRTYINFIKYEVVMIEKNILDLSKLSGNARRELVDFYEFLVLKYDDKKDNNWEEALSVIEQFDGRVKRWTRDELYAR